MKGFPFTRFTHKEAYVTAKMELNNQWRKANKSLMLDNSVA